METSLLQKKVCLLGSFGVGKTSLIRRFVNDMFDEKYLSTIGVTISRKQVMNLNMVIWDLAGGDDFNGKHTSYLQGASGAFLVCDVTRNETFEFTKIYHEKMGSIVPNAKTILIGNKIDLVESVEEATEKVVDLANQLNTPYFLTSAKTGEQVESSFQALAELLLKQTA